MLAFSSKRVSRFLTNERGVFFSLTFQNFKMSEFQNVRDRDILSGFVFFCVR